MPKDALKRVSLGQSFAEYDKLLEKLEVYVRTPALESAADKSSHKTLYVGRRGTGKTAITYYLSQTKKYVEQLHPQAYVPVQKGIELNQLLDTHQQYFKTLVSCYKRALLLEAVRVWLASKTVTVKKWPEKLNKEITYIEDHDFDDRLVTYLEEALDALKGNNQRRWLKLINRAKELGTEIEKLASDYGLECLLLIDRLDEAWDGSDWAVVFLMSLMHTCVELRATSKSIRPLLFVRENIFDRVRQINNEFARLETSIVSLDWKPNHLLELIERRLVLSLIAKPKLGGDVWDAFFEKIQGQPSWRYVLDYCQLRPRDILTFCNYAIEAALSNGHCQVAIEDIQAARGTFSENRLKDLGDEYAENFPQIQLVLSRFYGLGRRYTVNGTTSFIKKLLDDSEVKQACAKWIFNYSAPEKFIELLYNIGFLGIVEGQSVNFRAPGTQSGGPPVVSHATTVEIHPCYVDALALQDRLITHLQADIELRESGLILELPDQMDLTTYRASLTDVEDNLKTLPHGEGAPARHFEDIVGRAIKLCFFRSLTNVQPKERNVNNTMIRDWIASNIAASGFWEMIRQRYNSMQVVWECKNYADLSSSDFHQVNYYMTPVIGKFAVLVFRGEIKQHYYQHIKEIHSTNGGLVLLLTENDLKVFIRQARNHRTKESHIQDRLDQTLRSI